MTPEERASKHHSNVAVTLFFSHDGDVKALEDVTNKILENLDSFGHLVEAKYPGTQVHSVQATTL